MKQIINAIAWSVYLLAVLLVFALVLYSKDAIGAKYVISLSALWLMQVHNLTILEEK